MHIPHFFSTAIRTKKDHIEYGCFLYFCMDSDEYTQDNLMN